MKKVSKVFKIGISKDDGQKINEISEIEVLFGKGISGDRHFRDYNGYKGQITLIEKEIEIGTIKILPYQLCKPCLHLEQMLNAKNILKEFPRKGGLRCEVLVSGKVKIGDKIIIL